MSTSTLTPEPKAVVPASAMPASVERASAEPASAMPTSAEPASAEPITAEALSPELIELEENTVDAFGRRASDASIERTAEALRAKGYAVHVVENGDEARDVVLGLLPEGAEVGQGASITLEAIGVTHEIEESGRWDSVRKHTRSMDRSTPEGLRAMRKLGIGPDWYINSAHALTEDGTFVDVSNTGSQLAPLAFGAGEVIWVIGSQKIVPDLETAMRRIEEHTLPLENVRMQGLHGIDSEIKKVLIIHKEFRPSRFTVVLIKEPIGF